MNKPTFSDQLFSGLLRDSYSFQANNIDRDRFPEAPGGFARWLKDQLLALAARNGFGRRQFKAGAASHALGHIVAEWPRYQWLYDTLTDDASRELLVALLKFRVLGAGHVRLPLNNPRYWQMRAEPDARHLRERGTRRVGNWNLNRYEVDGAGGKINLHYHALGVCTTFLLEHYAYRNGATIAAEPGDVVIDGGGCWGDTALYFADKAGANGRVYCFEFDCANLETLGENLKLNPALALRIQVVQNALWNRSGETTSYSSQGPGSTLRSGGAGDATVETLSIDDLAAREKLARVDIIKMDIEGAELAALRGAEQVIRKFRPKLAISLYHKQEDFITIPEFLNRLDVGYQFYLGHYTIHQEETVLFATTKETAAA